MCELGGALVGRIFWGDRIFLTTTHSKKNKQKEKNTKQKTGKASCLKCWSSTFSAEKVRRWDEEGCFNQSLEM